MLRGLRAMALCGGQTDVRPPEGAFFGRGCPMPGDDAAAHTYYLETVGQNIRVDILQAARPSDVALARWVVVGHPEQARAYFWLGKLCWAGCPFGKFRLKIWRNSPIYLK